jgi:hypothetical protein
MKAGHLAFIGSKATGRQWQYGYCSKGFRAQQPANGGYSALRSAQPRKGRLLLLRGLVTTVVGVERCSRLPHAERGGWQITLVDASPGRTAWWLGKAGEEARIWGGEVGCVVGHRCLG